MYTLKLTIKREWFDLIKDGIKREEYREIKRYWIARLLTNVEYLTNLDDILSVGPRFKNYQKVEFRNGYDQISPTVTLEIQSISIGQGKPEWGAEPNQIYFIIKIGQELDRYNC